MLRDRNICGPRALGKRRVAARDRLRARSRAGRCPRRITPSGALQVDGDVAVSTRLTTPDTFADTILELRVLSAALALANALGDDPLVVWAATRRSRRRSSRSRSRRHGLRIAALRFNEPHSFRVLDRAAHLHVSEVDRARSCCRSRCANVCDLPYLARPPSGVLVPSPSRLPSRSMPFSRAPCLPPRSPGAGFRQSFLNNLLRLH